MYCSSCGNQIKKGLNYCNSCGVRIVDAEDIKSGSKGQNVSTAISYIGIAGIIGFIALVKLLSEKNIDTPAMVMILIAFSATIFGICFMLIKQLSGNSEKSNQHIEFQNDVPRTIKSVDTNQLEEPKHTPASVIENTTRILDKVPVERK